MNNYKKRRWILPGFAIACLSVLIPGGNIYGQGLSGTSGLFNIPVAYMLEDRTVILGAHFLHRDYGSYKYETDKLYEWHGVGTFATIAFLPWMEVQFRYTHLVDRVISPSTSYFPDRMTTFRFRLIPEGRYYPAVSVGFQDMLGCCTYFKGNYLVASKSAALAGFRAQGHLGYSMPFPDHRNPMRVPEGVFGGISLSLQRYPGLELMLEHDSYRWNIAGRVLLFKHLQILAGWYEWKVFSGGLSWRMVAK